MASDVGICNLALGHLGDEANISAIDPPEASAQAGYCATFYPMARDALLELHPWNFATRRAPLALLTQNDTGPWAYIYIAPNDMLNPLRVMDPNAPDDYSTGVTQPYTYPSISDGAPGIYTPQPYVTEADDAGNTLILTNLQDATLVYTVLISDTTKFTPLFVMTLTYLLASYLAGPIIKGSEGMAVAEKMLGKAMGFLGKAQVSDSNSRHLQVRQSVPWVVGR